MMYVLCTAQYMQCANDAAQCVNCRNAFCGDGHKRVDEECDDGNMINNDFCSNTCKVRTRVRARSLLIMQAEFP